MQSSSCTALVVLCVLFAPCGCVSVASNPLMAVVDLLGELSAKVKKEGENEAKAFKEYSEWCDDTKTNKGFEIKTAKADKAKLEAKIDEMTSIAEVATSKIADLAADISTCTSELKNATKIRQQEENDFLTNEKDLMEVIDTLDRASTILQRDMQKKGAALAQVNWGTAAELVQTLGVMADAAALNAAEKRQLVVLAQAGQAASSDEDELGAPAAAVYKSHSGSIFDLLEDLREKAETQLSDLRKAEATSRHNFEMLKQSLEDQVDADNKDMSKEKSSKSSAEETKSVASGDLQVTTRDLQGSEEALALAISTCDQSAKDHEETVKAREEELKVIAEAIQVLRETTDGAVQQSYSFIQADTVSRLHTRVDLVKTEVLAMVKHLAQKQHSSALAQLASRIASVIRLDAVAGEDPFAKIKAMLQDLVEKLEKEAGAEATEKAYCDKELAETSDKKAELSGDIAKLTSKIDQAGARATSLKRSVRELQSELAELTKSQAEMDKIRNEAHADYVAAKSDLEVGLAGVRKALTVLRDYYASKSEEAGESFLQRSAEMPTSPQKFAKAGGAMSSIIGILEQVEDDFAKSLAKEEMEEESAQESYTKLTQENKITKTTKEQDVKYQTKEASSLDKTISELSADRASVDAELSAVLEYSEKIKARCIARPETYEGRKARREAEIAGLKEALAALESEVAFMQRGRRGVQHLRGHALIGA